MITNIPAPASYVLIADMCGMVGNKPMRSNDTLPVHIFRGAGRESKIETLWIAWQQLTEVSSGTWDQVLREQHCK